VSSWGSCGLTPILDNSCQCQMLVGRDALNRVVMSPCAVAFAAVMVYSCMLLVFMCGGPASGERMEAGRFVPAHDVS
jgi:hypothetical protein